MGDRTRLQQVALNLVSNAIKFTEQGSVSLWVDVGRRNVVVAVSDTGMGIPVAEQEIIFDEFRQSKRRHAARLRRYGPGAGDQPAAGGVARRADRLAVVGDGRGRLDLLLHPADPRTGRGRAADTDQPRPGRAAAGRARRRGGTLQDHLAGHGFTVETLSIDGHPNWLAQIVMSPPGAVVLDYEPAAERGWELMQHLKLNPAPREIPVLFYRISEDRDSGAVLALDYLAKPVDDEALMRALARQGIACESSQRENRVGRR